MVGSKQEDKFTDFQVPKEISQIGDCGRIMKITASRYVTELRALTLKYEDGSLLKVGNFVNPMHVDELDISNRQSFRAVKITTDQTSLFEI